MERQAERPLSGEARKRRERCPKRPGALGACQASLREGKVCPGGACKEFLHRLRSTKSSPTVFAGALHRLACLLMLLLGEKSKSFVIGFFVLYITAGVLLCTK